MVGLKILITGGNGQLGTELSQALLDIRVVDEVFTPSSTQMDLRFRDSVLGAIVYSEPDVIVHAGAWTNVDGCEDDREKAFLINAMGTRFVVQGAELVGSRIYYISTDYVFSGDSSKPYMEWDAVGPRTIYGASKLAGEQELRDKDAIIRTSWVMGEHGNNMAKTLIRLSRGSERHRFVNDQTGTPTVVSDLVRVLVELMLSGHSGVFHASNAGETTWFDLARFVFDLLGEDPDRITAIRSSELTNHKAPRPAYSVLDNFALRSSGIAPLPDWQESVGRLVSHLAKDS